MRYTACLSTQVGCAMNCQFCYTGRMGLLGNLSTAQIVEQVSEGRCVGGGASMPPPGPPSGVWGGEASRTLLYPFTGKP